MNEAGPQRAAHIGAGRCRRRDRRRRRAGRRAVDDQHRHRRRQRDRRRRWRRWRAPAPRSCASPSTATRPPRRCRTSRSGCCKQGCDVPIVGDFHYIGHKLLADHPACAEALDKYRINPGNVGFKDKKDRQFGAIVETAIKHGKPVRIGANWGSLDQELLTHLMDENSRSNDAEGRARGHARGDDPVGAAVGAARRGDRACRATASSSPPRSRRCRT